MFDKFLLMLFLRNKDKLFTLYKNKDKDFQSITPYIPITKSKFLVKMNLKQLLN